MTLCVAVIDERKKIHILADSTATMNGCHSEIAVKALPTRVRIFEPQETSDSGEPISNPIYFDGYYGICFAGSFVGMQILKSYLDIALLNIQRWPFYETSFSDICSYVQNFYDEVCQRLSSELQADLTVDFFFSGACPTSKDLKLARFAIRYTKEDCFRTTWHVLPEGPGIYEIGNADSEFRDIVDATFGLSLLETAYQSLTRIINDKSIASVGGNVQYGRFDNSGDIETLGIVDGSSYFIGGIDINARPHSERSNLITRYSFIEP
jgi:hypothetical protein